MAAKILKLWHKWSWAFHIGAWLVGGTVMVCTYGNATANNTKDIASLQSENLPTRMAVQEETSRDINGNLQEIKQVQSKIFERINQIADRQYQEHR